MNKKQLKFLGEVAQKRVEEGKADELMIGGGPDSQMTNKEFADQVKREQPSKTSTKKAK